MRTIRTKVYKFEELSEEAKSVAIERERKDLCTDFIYDEAYETVKAFNNVFGLSEGCNSWLDCNTSNIEDSILELKGFRLQKYLWNNYGSDLFKGKWIGSLKSNEIFKHKRIQSEKLSNGNVYNPYYSGVTKETNCVLTGVYYDDEILQPIYEFLLKRDFSNCTITFYNLLNDCFEAIEKAIKNEIEHRESDEAITEDLEQNGYEFTENGNIF